jgi:hypothetical protein
VTVSEGGRLRLFDSRVGSSGSGSAITVTNGSSAHIDASVLTGINSCVTGDAVIDNSLGFCALPDPVVVTVRQSSFITGVSGGGLNLTAYGPDGAQVVAGTALPRVEGKRKAALIDRAGPSPDDLGQWDFSLRPRGQLADIGGVEAGPTVRLDGLGGDTGEPIVIRRAADFHQLPLVLDKDVRLARDIHIPDVDKDRGLSALSAGRFSGDGHRIGGLTRPLFAAGVFDLASVQNLRLTGDVECTEITCGAVAGSSGGTIEGVDFEGSVTGSGAATFVGGIVGQCPGGRMEDVTVDAAVSGDGSVGGIAGGTGSNCTITRGRFLGTATGTTSVGGAIGDHAGTATQLVLGSPERPLEVGLVTGTANASSSLRDVEIHSSAPITVGPTACGVLSSAGASVTLHHGDTFELTTAQARNPDDDDAWNDITRFRQPPWRHDRDVLPTLDLEAPPIASPACP